jgi:hypothetical protein
MSDHEKWADIPGYEGWYQASSHGQIRSVRRFGAEDARVPKTTLKPGYTTAGRQQVALSRQLDGEAYATSVRFLVHRLVYAAFHGPVPDGFEVRHRSDDFYNNREDNLIAQPKPQAITEDQARRIKFGNERQIDLAKEFDVSQTAISHIRTGKTRKHLAPALPGLFD